ncbi:MAG: pilus assembly protein TadG-related protein [Henriciella sp.]
MLGSGLITKLSDNQRGNVAMIFALAVIPIIGVAGFALDAQMTFSKKSKVQHAVDSAVLAGARLRQTTNDEEEVRENARAYFSAMLTNAGNGMHCDDLQVKFVGDEDIEADVDCYQPTTLTRIFGREKMQFSVSSTATYGIGKLDVSFVFDISGSMNSYGRLDDLIDAAKDAAEIILPEPGASGAGDVRIAMVAYNSMIDAGPYFEEVTGLKPRRTYYELVTYTDEEWYEEEYTDWDRECEEVCTKYNKHGKCTKSDWECEWVEVTKTRWNTRDVEKTRMEETTITSTCVFERGGDHKFTDTQPDQLSNLLLLDRLPSGAYNAQSSNANDEGYLAAGYAYWDDRRERWRTVGVNDCRDVEPFELNDNGVQIEKYIEDLTAGGNTAGHQGIEWGWYLISPEFSDVFDVKATPLPYDEPDSAKVMIIMTDGEFNSQFFSSQGNSRSQAESMCDSIKDAGVLIYSVAFQAPNSGKEVLKECASGNDFYFAAESGEQLRAAYQTIATQISDLRISH